MRVPFKLGPQYIPEHWRVLVRFWRAAFRLGLWLAAVALLIIGVARSWAPAEGELALALLAGSLAANIFTLDYPDSKRISCAYMFGLVATFTLGVAEAAAVTAIGAGLAGMLRPNRWSILRFHAPASAVAVAIAGALTSAVGGDPFGAISLAGLGVGAAFAVIYTAALTALVWVERHLVSDLDEYPKTDLVTNLLLVAMPVSLLVASTYAGENALLLSSMGVAALLIVIQSSVNTATANGHLRRAQAELEQQRTALQDALELNKELAQVITHDLRGPLTSMMGHAELLRRDITQEVVTEQSKDHNDRILYNGRRMARLIDNLGALNDVSQDSGLQFVELDPTLILGQAVDELREMAEERQIRLDLAVERSAERVNSNEWVLRRVADNLISNALKYTPQGGHVDVHLLVHPDDVILEVSDDGIGISPDDQKKLFLPFFRSDAAHVQAMPGTGLGLALTRQIVLRLGGSIEVSSKPGCGSRFTVRLPTQAPVGARA